MLHTVYQQCIDITKKMIDNPLCLPFSEPIDPIQQQCINYFQVIKNPMDLKTVMNKLESSLYKDVNEWASDIELIWKNAFTFNTNESPIFLMALDNQQWFQKKLSKIYQQIQEKWYVDLQDAVEKLNDTLMTESAKK